VSPSSADAPGPAPTPRVAAVHRQTRRTLLLAAGFAIAAAVAAIAPHDTGSWLPLHLLLVGALLLAISGATRLFVVTWSAAEPHGDVIVAVQRWLLAAGAAGIAVSREADLPTWTIAAAGVSVGASLVVLGWLLVTEQRRARVARFAAATRFYLTAVGFGLVGTALGILTATGRATARDEHVIVNVLGLVGCVIAGTLPTFVATQARTKMSRRATSTRLHVVLGGLSAGVATAALGAAEALEVVVRVGLAVYVVSLLYLFTLLPAIGGKQLRWAGARLVQLAIGCGWWTVGVAVGVATGTLSHRAVVAVVIGGYAQILLGSLAYLVPVLRGGGHEHLSSGFRATRSWPSVVTLNVGAAALVAGWTTVAGITLTLTVLDALGRGLSLREVRSRGARTDS
jgi:nitrite reductase (NO-forming)